VACFFSTETKGESEMKEFACAADGTGRPDRDAELHSLHGGAAYLLREDETEEEQLKLLRSSLLH